MSLLIPGDEMKTAGTPDIPWLIEPYIPREGIVFLYGKKGVGKSPLTWSLTRSVATGEPWLGLPVQTRGTVLYIEVDSPLSVVKIRTDHIAFPREVLFYFPTDPLLASREGYRRLVEETKEIRPALVIINTLRKIHVLRDTESATVAQIYGLFKRLWPCVLFVHHEKKSPSDPDQAYERGEEFTGALAWHNDAQVCLNLKHAPGVHPQGGYQNLILVNTGNQLHAQPPDLRLSLAPDGYTITPRLALKNPQNPKTNST